MGYVLGMRRERERKDEGGRMKDERGAPPPANFADDFNGERWRGFD
jgi:hypothetical protein